MKRCYGSCKRELSSSEFARNPTKKDGLDAYCRACRKEYNQAYYQRTKDRHNPGRYAARRAHRDQVTANVHAYLRANCCVDCGESDIVVLEFDHLHDKVDNISDLLQRGRSWAAVQAEIEKCDVVCANCHRRRTARTYDWRKGR